MSIKVMSLVFERYPKGGGEMLLALALADHAHDDGTHIFPKVETLADKTRQSIRSVQYQLRRMEQLGWLIRVNSGHGGRSQSSEYRIAPEWLKGAEIAPLAPQGQEKGAIDDMKGCNPRPKGCKTAHKRVHPVAPAYNHHEPSITIIESSAPQTDPDQSSETGKKSKVGLSVDDLVHRGVERQVAMDWLQVRRDKRSRTLTLTAIEGVEAEAKAAGLSLNAALRVCVTAGWMGFRAAWYNNQHKTNASHTQHDLMDAPRDYTKGIGKDGRF